MVVQKIKLFDKQLEAYKYLTDNKTEVILYGGSANNGKSYLGCLFLLFNSLKYPFSVHALCRKSLKELKNTSLKTFKKVCREIGLTEKEYTIDLHNNVIKFYNKSEILLIPLAWQPSDPDADFLGGLELTSCVIEEIPQIPLKYYEVMYSRVRYLDPFNLTKKLFLTTNPSDDWVKTYFYDRYIKGILPDTIKFVSTVGSNNPFRGRDYEKTLSLLSEKNFKRLELGDWDYASANDQLFTNDKIEEILTGLSYGIETEYFITADIARFGEDNTVICVWQGFSIIKIIKLNGSDIKNSADEIFKLMQEFKIPKNKVIADSDGVGGGVVDILKCVGFVNNSKPFKGEKFDMMKSQMYFKLSKTPFSISNKIKQEYKEQIVRELKAIRDNSDDSKYKINSKDEQKLLLGNKSPDFSDSIMMRMYFTYACGQLIFDIV